MVTSGHDENLVTYIERNSKSRYANLACMGAVVLGVIPFGRKQACMREVLLGGALYGSEVCLVCLCE